MSVYEEVVAHSAHSVLTVHCKECDWTIRGEWRHVRFAKAAHMETHAKRFPGAEYPLGSVGCCMLCGDPATIGRLCWAHSDIDVEAL